MLLKLLRLIFILREPVAVCAQRETLLRQLETNQLDMDATLEELCVQQETEDQNYEMYGLLLCSYELQCRPDSAANTL